MLVPIQNKEEFNIGLLEFKRVDAFINSYNGTITVDVLRKIERLKEIRTELAQRLREFKASNQ